MVGVPAAVSVFLFDLVTIVINKLTTGYGNHVTPLAAMGIVLKLERIPINTGLGICLGMVPLIAYNFGSGNQERLYRFSTLARRSIIIFSLICTAVFFIFAKPLAGAFIEDGETVRYAVMFLQGRCFALPFMMIGYHIVNFMNAVNRGKVSFLLAVLRHVIIIIPVMLIMNSLWGLTDLIWLHHVTDFTHTAAAILN